MDPDISGNSYVGFCQLFALCTVIQINTDIYKTSMCPGSERINLSLKASRMWTNRIFFFKDKVTSK